MTEWRPRPRRHPVPQLSLAWRIFFIASGWILLLIGVAGLALPGIQGFLTIALGAALLSLASETTYWALRWAFQRWPRGWRRMVRMRRRVHAWLGADASAAEADVATSTDPQGAATGQAAGAAANGDGGAVADEGGARSGPGPDDDVPVS